ncbi:MAG: hypothetical protein KH353_04700 [Clostridium sp.]|nr:hypothetical protein [Clostridium sp.]
MVKGFILAEDEKKTIEECDILFCVGVKSIEKNDISLQVEIQKLLMGGNIRCRDFIAAFGEAAAETIVELAEEKPEMALAMSTLFLESFHRSFKTAIRQQKDKREE